MIWRPPQRRNIMVMPQVKGFHRHIARRHLERVILLSSCIYRDGKFFPFPDDSKQFLDILFLLLETVDKLRYI